MAIIFSDHLEYFDDYKPRPIAKDRAAPTKEEAEAHKAWQKEDNGARYLLSQCVPDSAVLTFNSCTSFQQCWKQISDKYQAKSQYAQNDLEQVFLDMRCSKGGNVRTFLTSVRNKCEELAAVGVTITNRDYQRMVLKCIPEELAKFTTHWQLLTFAGPRALTIPLP